MNKKKNTEHPTGPQLPVLYISEMSNFVRKKPSKINEDIGQFDTNNINEQFEYTYIVSCKVGNIQKYNT